jgi:hypothetical protein
MSKCPHETGDSVIDGLDTSVVMRKFLKKGCGGNKYWVNAAN